MTPVSQAACFLLLAMLGQAQGFAPRAAVVAVVDVTLKWQTRTIWLAAISNESPLQVQIPLPLIAAAPGVPAILTKSQIATAVSNGFWALAGRTVQEGITLAPLALTATSLTTKSPGYGYVGLGISIASYFVLRAQAHTGGGLDNIPDLIPLPPYGTGLWLVHVPKGPKTPAAPIAFQLRVVVP